MKGRTASCCTILLSLCTFSVLSSTATSTSASMSRHQEKINSDNSMKIDHNSENSSLPSPEIIAARLGVKPTSKAPSIIRRGAYRIHKRLIPLLHSTDSCRPPDSSLNIACMWWKALSGNDKSSPVHDNGLAYDMLPSGWRNIVIFRRFYPRFHHGNVELRTAYLDNQIDEIVADIRQRDCDTVTKKKIRLVCMGAGYDTRGVKMLERGTVDHVVELDLPDVVDAKERLFARLMKRRSWLSKITMPKLVPSDFNDVSNVKRKLETVLRPDDNGIEGGVPSSAQWHTIFLFEGVMIYLNKNVPGSLLNVTSAVLKEKNLDGSLCFADLLDNVPGGDFVSGVNELRRNGWSVKDWSPKPGRARHMGSAALL